jgi:diaminohydroxyphosphoribosylaminopyrimidine deaminase / 5-amino-6-(5-phosphoribosylamino)uracil reductase
VTASVTPDVTVADRHWLLAAIALSRSCPAATSAYSVGAIVVDAGGGELSRGYSRELDPTDHAEETALAKLAGVDAGRATIYTSLEPCGTRKSRLRTCTELILAAGIRRVVFAMREPPLFVECHGAEILQAAGVEVVELADLADLVRQVNAHLFRPGRLGAGPA